jgi:hypothetical protein
MLLDLPFALLQFNNFFLPSARLFFSGEKLPVSSTLQRDLTRQKITTVHQKIACVGSRPISLSPDSLPSSSSIFKGTKNCSFLANGTPKERGQKNLKQNNVNGNGKKKQNHNEPHLPILRLIIPSFFPFSSPTIVTSHCIRSQEQK